MLGFFSNSTDTVMVWPSTTGTRLQCALTLAASGSDAVTREVAQDLLRLLLHLLFFAADERNHVGVDVHRSDARITRAGNRLHGGHDHARDAELLQRRERHGQHDGGAIGIGDDLPFPAALALLVRNQLQMIGVDLRDQQRNVRLHAMIARIRNDDVSGLGERLLDLGGDRRVHRGEHQPRCGPGLTVSGLHSDTDDVAHSQA